VRRGWFCWWPRHEEDRERSLVDACSIPELRHGRALSALRFPLLQALRSDADLAGSVFDTEPRRLACPSEQLGPDRWAALVAARALHTGACLVVNAGTATTVDRLSADGEFTGGVILPGVELMRFVLHEHTGRLPIQEGRLREAPRNTADAIETGCRHAQAGTVERMFRAMGGNPLCIVSGGNGRQLIELLTLACRYVENLVLDGLGLIALDERARESSRALRSG